MLVKILVKRLVVDRLVVESLVVERVVVVELVVGVVVARDGKIFFVVVKTSIVSVSALKKTLECHLLYAFQLFS